MTDIATGPRASADGDGLSKAPPGTTVITKRFGFESAHFLPHVPTDHKCRRMHGHSYQVWLHVTGAMDRAHGWIVDFGDIKAVWKDLEARLDHRLLNEIPGLENPTAENLAAWIAGQMEEARRAGRAAFSVAAVEVAETADSKALFVAAPHRPWVPGHPAVALPPPSSPAPFQTPPALPADDLSARPLRLSDATRLEDVQARPDTRGVALHEVGVTRVRMPIEVLDRDQGRQATVGHVTLAVDLPAEVKGTHLSRFMQALRDHQDALTLFSLGALTGDLRTRLDASRVRARVEFPYFVPKRAPVTGEVGTLDVDCAFELVDDDGDPRHWLEVATPVTTVCPCSRDISDYGAHNQRGTVSVRLRCSNDPADLPALVWIEEVVEAAEAAASAPVYPVVKRPDERHITMAAYDRPRFVEDVVREVMSMLSGDPRIAELEVRAENDESIHAHNAFAVARWNGGRLP